MDSITTQRGEAAMEVAQVVGIRLACSSSAVAQISNLLFRRFLTCRSFLDPNALANGQVSADWKSAIQQVENLRYSLIALVRKAGTVFQPAVAPAFLPASEIEPAVSRNGIGGSSSALVLL